jgi:GGDEF domain-containing protein
MEESGVGTHIGFGVLRIRILGLEEFRATHGHESVVPFLRAAARTLRLSLDGENFLGCWAENEFLAVLPSANPAIVAATAESLWNLLHHSEVSWWGDKFLVNAEVSYAVSVPGSSVESLLGEMKLSQSSKSLSKSAKAAGGEGRPQ